jgi:hypothetical protein
MRINIIIKLKNRKFVMRGWGYPFNENRMTYMSILEDSYPFEKEEHEHEPYTLSETDKGTTIYNVTICILGDGKCSGFVIGK